jgi:transcriptional regulator with XRE-family HTH domain
MAMIEARLAASKLLKATRERKKLTQLVAAARLKTSQSRLAKMEAGHSSVSIDLLLRSLFALGVSGRAVATIFEARGRGSRNRKPTLSKPTLKQASLVS